MENIKKITRQLLLALLYLQGDCKITHADLKLGNVLLRDDRTKYCSDSILRSFLALVTCRSKKSQKCVQLKDPDVKVVIIDYGFSLIGSGYHPQTKGSVGFLAPEVILLIGTSKFSDSFSLG